MNNFQDLKNSKCNFWGFITSEIRNPGNENPQFQKSPEDSIQRSKKFLIKFLGIFGLRNPQYPSSKVTVLIWDFHLAQNRISLFQSQIFRKLAAELCQTGITILPQNLFLNFFQYFFKNNLHVPVVRKYLKVLSFLGECVI